MNDTTPRKGRFHMMMLKKILVLCGMCFLSACVSVSQKPDLALLYRSSHLNDNASPIIIIPGLMGTTLVNAKGEEVWPKSASNLAFSRFDELATGIENDGIVPGRLFDSLAGIDFYGTLLETLEKVGRYEKSQAGTPVPALMKNKRRYYVFLYDWRKSNFQAVQQLHALIEQIRQDYRDPALKVDIIAHSNGGLIARYYLQYGPQAEASRANPTAWKEGELRIHRIAMLGTPNLGSVESVNRLYQGFRIGLRPIPPQILSYFATPFEALPSPKSTVFIDGNGTPVDLDVFDPALWHRNEWSIFSPAVREEVRKNSQNPDKALAQLDARFTANLQQAKHFQMALSKPFAPTKTEIALFGGDCKLTSARALVENDGSRQVLAFEEDQVRVKKKNTDYKQWLQAPGDGLVTRESQLARASNLYLNAKLDRDLFPIAQTTFFCETHELLTANPYFQNNLLYFLFH
jgi:pimeloyl-ACP methyl ester carboxylesterase